MQSIRQVLYVCAALSVLLVAWAALAVGDSAPSRPDKPPRGHFYPPQAYQDVYSHVDPALTIPRRELAAAYKHRGRSVLLHLDNAWRLRKKQQEEAIARGETLYDTVGSGAETAYDAPPPPAPTPLFRLPGE